MGLEGFAFERLEEADLDEVVLIERQSFTTPWSRALFLEELRQPQLCHWYKARPLHPGGPRVAAYMGFWKAVDEAHITNLAVRPEFRRRGLGRELARHLLAQALALGCRRASLEVRVGNAAATALYEKLGFVPVAIRRKYYPDNDEDALVMLKEGL